MSTWTAARQISSATGYMLLRLGDLARDRIESELRRWEISGKELRVLGYAHGQELSQRDLCELADTDRTTMVAVIDKLERLGYARRTRSDADRRKQLVVLTDQGRRVVEEALAHMTEVEAGFLAPLEPAERRQLNDMIARLYAAHDPACSAP
ncbi:MarR family winged helix-turn-helix transcriptional regulator [Streptosporangium carneum]|uniref:MarR family transcriptional regulator n=1 Tax=Streptosporangium carneum TaxID=47481 RepID=A0A9W6I597_9ACTN|nr:MarR family transcriptional regulator [Streptosporangium carneum]GLK11195.1 MarR family transcriptional regulator [Streptosporangium carneum]